MPRIQNVFKTIAAGLAMLAGTPMAMAQVTSHGSFPRTDVLSNQDGGSPAEQSPPYKPGDADRDFDFDQHDLVQVIRARKYQTGLPASWSEGDWNVDAAGFPAGDGVFDQHDLMTSLTLGSYLGDGRNALAPDGQLGDLKTSILYEASTGVISLDAPFGSELTSINIDSAAGVFVGTGSQNLGGSFDHHADYNIFKATFGSSFGSITFGAIAEPGLSREFLLQDLTIVGSLDMGGALGEVDMIYVPEPASAMLVIVGTAIACGTRRRRS